MANVCSSGFYWLRQLRRVRRSLDTDSMKTLVHAFVMSHVDYCNAILAVHFVVNSRHLQTENEKLSYSFSLYCYCRSRYITDKLQRLLNTAARLITATRKFDHGLSLLLHDELHWLDIPERVHYKLGVAVHGAPMSARQGPQVPDPDLLTARQLA